jgi:hypothetical protein
MIISSVAVLIAFGVTVWLGGFREAPAARSTRWLEAGQDFDVGPLSIRVLRAWSGSMCPLDSIAGPPDSCLSVEADVINLTRSSRSLGDAVRLVEPALPREVFPKLELVRDRWVLGTLHPNLPERVVISWKLPTEQHMARSHITIALWSTRFKERDNLVGGEGWFDPQEAARIRLPLTEADPAAMRVQNRP